MRFVEKLPEYVKETLTEMYKNHPKGHVRRRAKIVLLSGERYKINEIAKIQEVRRNTVSSNLTRWEKQGIVGLLGKAKKGRPRVLTAQEEDLAKKLIAEDPGNNKKAQSKLEEKTGKKISAWTFKRSLKRAEIR